MVRRDLHALAERVARIEGTISGRWRPSANGSPRSGAQPAPGSLSTRLVTAPDR